MRAWNGRILQPINRVEHHSRHCRRNAELSFGTGRLSRASFPHHRRSDVYDRRGKRGKNHQRQENFNRRDHRTGNCPLGVFTASGNQKYFGSDLKIKKPRLFEKAGVLENQKFMIIPYQTKTKKLSGTNYAELRKHTLLILSRIKSETKRRPYIRSAYFNKQKIFFDYFWTHLMQKNSKERVRRLKYFEAALKVIKKSRNHPTSGENPHKKSEVLHRFAGLTEDGELFYIQVKEDRRSGKKYFMSCFPAE